MFLLGSLLLALIIRIPSFFEPVWLFDEPIYLVVGNAVRNGAVLYKDIFDHKPPSIYYFAGLFANILYVRLFLFILLTATIVLFYEFSKYFTDGWYRKLSVIIFTVIMALPWLQTTELNAEVFIVFFSLAGLVLVLRYKGSVIMWFFSGLLLGLGHTFKFHAVFELLAITVWLLFFTSTASKYRKLVLFWAGFVLPICLWAGYFFYLGTFKEFIKSVYLFNFSYITPHKEHTAYFVTDAFLLNLVYLIIGLLFLYVMYIKNKISVKDALPVLYFTFALFGAVLGQRGFSHYLIPVISPFSILVSLFFRDYYNLNPRLFLYAYHLVWLIIFVSFYSMFWSQISVGRYYTNFIEYSGGDKSHKDYEAYFYGNKDGISYTREADNLGGYGIFGKKTYICGSNFPLYYLTKSIPPVKYFADFQINNQDTHSELWNGLTGGSYEYIYIRDPDKSENAFCEELSSYLKEQNTPGQKTEFGTLYTNPRLPKP